MRQAIFLALLALSIAASAVTIAGRVVRVADGDSITILDVSHVQHKIRLAGIDAPERSQPYGHRSKESLSELTFDKKVEVETYKLDRYGREVGKVLLDGRDVNLIQIGRGMSWFYRQYQREQSPEDRRLYESTEMDARSVRRGLWRDADPIEPREFRRNKGK